MLTRQYASTLQALRRPLDPAATDPELELVRLAVLAGNGHNTQPWRFELGEDRIRIRPDRARRTPVVDPDDHHLFASLGCAAENLAVAATHFGRTTEVRGSAEGVDVTLFSDGGAPSPLVRPILERQCTRLEYDGRGLPSRDLERLFLAGQSSTVACKLFSSRQELRALEGLVVEANTAQLEDARFVDELCAWIRFNQREALGRRDGLHSKVMGSPPLPSWLGRRLLPLVLRPKPENGRYVRQIRSSAGLAVFSAEKDAPEGWIEAGRAYQRFALVATELGVRHAFLNQPVEVERLRPQLASFAGLGARRPNLMVRFGYGPLAAYSLRRPVEAVVTRNPTE